MWSLLGKIAMKGYALVDKTGKTYEYPKGETWGKFKFATEDDAQHFGWINYVYKYLEPTLWAIMAIVGAAGAIYAIVLGVNLARAEDQAKRDEAKKRLVTVLIAVAVTIALVLFFNLLLPYIISAFSDTMGV